MRLKKFLVGNLFELINNPQLDKYNFNFNKLSKFPYFTRTETNNGILGYVDYLDEEHKIPGNSLAVGMISMRFHYMNHDFYAGQFTKTAIPKFECFNERIAMYFISIFNKKAEYYKRLLIRNFESAFLNDEIELPTKDGINPDFNYMNDYIMELEQIHISELEKERINKLNSYLKITELDGYDLDDDDIQTLNTIINTKPIKIGELFEIKTGRDVIINALENGDIPLVSHQCNNNGITKHIKRLTNRILFNYKSTIALADRGVFHATCQNSDFHIGTRVKALIFKDGEKTENQRLFMVSIINKLQFLFADYLTNATDKLPDLEICIPITSDNKPDYNYMEKYIRAIKKMIIKEDMEYKDKVISKTKQICEI